LKVLTAMNGQEVVKIVKKHPFELILMDIQIPVIDGLSATKAIRALSGQYASIPILALTVNCFPSDIAETKAAGMNGHIGKPIVPKILYFDIAKYLNTADESAEIDHVQAVDKNIWAKNGKKEALLQGIIFDVLLEKTLGNSEFKRKNVMTKEMFTALSSPIKDELLIIVNGIQLFLTSLPKPKEEIGQYAIPMYSIHS
jgi:CheY-like chemotaxis protein